jgi:DNA-binding FadR family transcriptional regulator
VSQSGQSVDRERVEPATRLGDQLYHRLALLIERGEFAEGGRLPPESELAERFRVSRPVIREALSRLRSVGVIISRRGSGSFVQKRADRPAGPRSASSFGPITSLAEVRQCYAFRACVESEAAFHAAQNRSPEALGAMRDALDRIEVAIARGLVGMDADYEFHAGVAQASGNPFFEGVMEAMRTPIEFTIELARNLSMRRPLEHLLTVQAEHVAVFEAIQRGEPEPARAAMRLHVENSCHRVFEGPGGVAGR